MFEKYLIAHREWGVFLGSAMGMAFWSKMDAVGQDQAVVFDTELRAEEYLKTWDWNGEEQPDEIGIHPVLVATEDQGYATMEECENSGFDAWDPGDPHIRVNVKVEMATIIQKAERLILDAAAKKDPDWLMRLGTMLQSLAHSASRRSAAVEHEEKGEAKKAELFTRASRDAMERAALTLEDDKWATWQETGKPPTPEIVTVKPEGAAANDSITRPKDKGPRLLH